MGIPTFIKKDQENYIDETIDYHNLTYFELYISNAGGKIFGFAGWVDNSIKFKKIVRWVNEGMHRLSAATAGRERFVFKRRNMVMKVNTEGVGREGREGREKGRSSIKVYEFYGEQYN